MQISEIQLTQKHHDIRNDRSRVIFAEGTTNAGKSFIFGITFFERIFESPEKHVQFVLGGESLPVLEKMYIQNPSSFYNIFKPLCNYTSSGQGGARIEITTPTGTKIMYLVGYDNKARWKKILGLTIHGWNIEEITIADDEFIDEAILRTFRNGGFLLGTSNGADPDLPVYKNHLNKCRPLEKYAHELPKEIWNELNQSEPDERFRYYFFNFDDNPSMSEQEKQDLIETTPKNSYQWLTKILGIRGIREGVIYADYMTREKNIIDINKKIDNKLVYQIQEYTIGIDVGGTDHTVFTLNGFTKNYKEHIVLDYFKINNANHDQIWEAFEKWFKPYYEQYSLFIRGAFIDNAAKIMRLSIDARMQKAYGLRCYGAKKYTIKERVDWGITQVDQARLLFTKKAEDIYIAFTKAYYETKSKTDIRGFSNHTHKDMVDSVEYGQSIFTVYMMRS